MHSEMNRRNFLTQSSALVTAGAVVASQAGAAVKEKDNVSLPIVDTHQHLWDLDKFTLPWLSSDGVESLRRSFVMKDYFEATEGVGIAKTVYMEVNVAQSDQQKEAEYVIDLCKRDDNPMAAAVIGGYPHDAGFADYIKPLAKNDFIKGVRTVLHDPDRPKGLCLTPGFVKSIKLLGDLGLSFDLCMRPDEIADGVRLAKRCPNTRFIVDHCGNMPVESDDKALRAKWMDGMQAAAQQDNMVCKISGIVVTAKKEVWKPEDLAPNMNFCMQTFGDDRVFFGGDWPVCTLKSSFARWADALKQIVKDRSPEFQRKLFHDNAVKQYGLG